MKKFFFTLAIALGFALTASAQGGLFDYGTLRGEEDPYYSYRDAPSLMLPDSHGLTTDEGAPLGTGTAILLGLGAAYLVGKKKQKK